MAEFSPHIEQLDLLPNEGFALFEQIFETKTPDPLSAMTIDTDCIETPQRPCFGF